MKPSSIVLVVGAFILLLLGRAQPQQQQQPNEIAKVGVLVEQPSASISEPIDFLSTRNGSISEVLDMALLFARSNQLTGRVNIIPIYENGVTFLNLYEKACQLLGQGVVAIVAPSVPSMAPLVAAIGTKYGILTILPASISNDPTIASSEAMIASRATSPLASASLPVPGPTNPKPGVLPQMMQKAAITPAPLMLSDSTSVVIRPRQDFVADAIEDYIISEKWDSFTIIYEDPNALAYLQSLLHLGRPRVSDFYLESQAEHAAATSQTAPKTISGERPSQSTVTYHVFLRQLRPAVPGTTDYRPLLKDLRESGVSRFVIDCRASTIASFLQQALQVNMLNVYFHYFFTSLDANLVDYAAYWYGGANITYLQLANQTRNVRVVEERLTKIGPLASYSSAVAPSSNRNTPPPPRQKRRWTAADLFLFDGVLSMANAIGNLSRVQKLDSTPVVCDKPETAEYRAVGENLLNYMRTTVDLSGLTGQVNIDERGWRTSVALDITRVNRQDGSMERYAEWRPNNGGIKILAALQQVRKETEPFFRNKTLVVTTIVEEPFVMFRKPKPGEILDGNARFEGYCVDLMEKLAEVLHFKYELKLVDDGQYGAPVDPSAMRWNGMVGELLSKKADVAIAPLTITYIREQVIDFTTPYMNLGISILYRKPKQEPPTLFSFMNPLEVQVWIYVLGAYVATSIILYIVARVTPYEWVRKPACQHEPNPSTVENQFTLFNSLWFTISSLMQQGCDIAPRAFSTRIIGSVWSFFTLIIISSYTANLAAFLTIERLQTDITSAEDLAKQSDIKYGTRSSGSTMTFFKNSKIPTYEKMWNYMSTAQPTVFVNSSTDGIMRVKAGGYAFLMESTMIEYQVQRDCDLMQVGGLLDSKGYGIGLPRGSPLREDISNAILKLQEDQFLHLLKIRWWVEKSTEKPGVGKCDTSEISKTSTSQLGIGQVGGVFACLVIGLAVGILLSIFEFCYRIKRRQTKAPPGTSFTRQMIDQCRLILHFKSVKPPPRNATPLPAQPSFHSSQQSSQRQASVRSNPQQQQSGQGSRISHDSRVAAVPPALNRALGPNSRQSSTTAPLLQMRPSTSFDDHDQTGGLYQRHPAQQQRQSSKDSQKLLTGVDSSQQRAPGGKSLNDIKFNAHALSVTAANPAGAVPNSSAQQPQQQHQPRHQHHSRKHRHQTSDALKSSLLEDSLQQQQQHPPANDNNSNVTKISPKYNNWQY